MNKYFRCVLICILSVIVLFSSFKVIEHLVIGNREKKTIEEVFEQVVSQESAPDVPQDGVEDKDKDEVAVVVKKPLSDVNIKKLFKLNSDSIGWLSIPNTRINYPVMHTPYDNEKYLHKDFYKKSSRSGVPFLDGWQTLESDNIFIYGHNMKNGTMFWSLKKFKNASFLRRNKKIYFKTIEGISEYHVYAVIETSDKSEWYNYYGEITEETFKKMMKYIDKNARVKSDAKVNFGDKLLTLSTCGSSEDERLLVIAVKKG